MWIQIQRLFFQLCEVWVLQTCWWSEMVLRKERNGCDFTTGSHLTWLRGLLRNPPGCCPGGNPSLHAAVATRTVQTQTRASCLSVLVRWQRRPQLIDWLNRFMGCIRKGFRLISGICVGLQFDKMLSNLKPYSRFMCLSKVRSSLLQIQTKIKEIQTASNRPALKTLLSVNPSPHGAMGTLFACYLVLTELHPIVSVSVTTFHLPQAVCPQTLPVGQQLKKEKILSLLLSSFHTSQFGETIKQGPFWYSLFGGAVLTGFNRLNRRKSKLSQLLLGLAQ